MEPPPTQPLALAEPSHSYTSEVRSERRQWLLCSVTVRSVAFHPHSAPSRSEHGLQLAWLGSVLRSRRKKPAAHTPHSLAPATELVPCGQGWQTASSSLKMVPRSHPQ